MSFRLHAGTGKGFNQCAGHSVGIFFEAPLCDIYGKSVIGADREFSNFSKGISSSGRASQGTLIRRVYASVPTDIVPRGLCIGTISAHQCPLAFGALNHPDVILANRSRLFTSR